MLSRSFIITPFEKANYNLETCPTCNMTLLSFRKEGRLGCSSCYRVFKKELTPMIKKYHGEDRHIGKSSPGNASLDMKLNELNQELKLRITEEDYEKAAIIRDLIEDIKSNMR